MALLRNVSKVAACAHMPFIGSIGSKFFLKIQWKTWSAIKTTLTVQNTSNGTHSVIRRDSRYIGLTMATCFRWGLSINVMKYKITLIGKTFALIAIITIIVELDDAIDYMIQEKYDMAVKVDLEVK